MLKSFCEDHFRAGGCRRDRRRGDRAVPAPAKRSPSPSPLTSGKGDRLDIRAVGPDCSKQAWPYYEASCVKDRREAMSQAKPARIVTADRVSVTVKR